MRALIVSVIGLLGLAMGPSTAADAAVAAASQTAQTGTPPAGSASRIVFSATLPADVLPTGPAVVGLLRFTLGPGASVTYPVGSSPPSVAFEVIGAGTYGVTSGGRLLVVRAAAVATPGAGQMIPPGTEVTLGPGDAVVYLDNDEAVQTVRNLGQETVVGLSAGIFSTATTTAQPVVTGDYQADFLGSLPETAWSAIPAGPVAVTLSREPLAADAPEPTPAAGTLQIVSRIPGEEAAWVLRIAPVVTEGTPAAEAATPGA
jgi:hypothetical protein